MVLNCSSYECEHECDATERWCECYKTEPDLDIDCPNFKINNTCRWCKHSVLAFGNYDDELDFEEDYKCKLDDNVYQCYMMPFGEFYPCKIGKFELNED